jgi:hypothetical protein
MPPDEFGESLLGVRPGVRGQQFRVRRHMLQLIAPAARETARSFFGKMTFDAGNVFTPCVDISPKMPILWSVLECENPDDTNPCITSLKY